MTMTDPHDLLERLSNEIGPSGRERSVRALIRSELMPPDATAGGTTGLVDRIDVDALGNLIAFKAGTGPEPRLRVMLAAHMDEVGFMITKIEKTGMLRFQVVGGLDARLLLAKRLVIGDERVAGIIGAPPPHLLTAEQEQKVLDLDSLAIDIGADSDKSAEAKVKIGDYGAFATRFAGLSDDPAWPTVRGKAFDDRAGCAVLIGILAERYPVDIYGVFTVQEEVGLRGARVAAYRIEPDAAFALEGTVCHDVPGPEDEDVTPVTRLGDGPAVTLMDRSLFAHPGLIRLLQETAAAEGIPMQYKAPAMGGTDSGAIHLTRGGVPATTVAVPCRYIHSPAAILNLNDLSNTVRLLSAALRRLNRDYLVREL